MARAHAAPVGGNAFAVVPCSLAESIKVFVSQERNCVGRHKSQKALVKV